MSASLGSCEDTGNHSMAKVIEPSRENAEMASHSRLPDKDVSAEVCGEEADVHVPLLDLTPIHLPIWNDLQHAVSSVLASNRFIGGEQLDGFEQELASYCGAEHAIGVSSGTDALVASLMAFGVGPGDEVIVPSFTFFSTAGSVHRVGARIVFCDIDPVTFNMDTGHYSELITDRTRAVIPVDLFGQCADMERIGEVSSRKGIVVIEDAAQAIGAQYHGRMAGCLGATGCFSFFPSKNLGGIGDGGAVVTRDNEVAERIRSLRNHGQMGTYYHVWVGGNFRMDAIQAAALRVKLTRLERWHEQRRANAFHYRDALADLEDKGLLGLPVELADRRHVFNQFVIRVKERNALQKYLADQHIGTAVYYPVPLHLQPCFTELGYKEGTLPVTEKASREVLALPIYPGLTEAQRGKVVRCIREFVLR